MFQTVLKLALINGYDSRYRIRNKSGEFIPNSNLLDLIHHAMSVGKNLAATDDFVDLLAEAEVEPEWIVNDNIKSMLKAKRIQRPTSLPLTDINMVEPTQLPPTPEPPKPINPITTGAYWGPERVAHKRRLATYQKPPNFTPRTYKPRTTPSPVSPDMPTLERMDGPPASPPEEMPRLKAMKRGREPDSESDGEDEPANKKLKDQDFRERLNKSMNWALPDEDQDIDI